MKKRFEFWALPVVLIFALLFFGGCGGGDSDELNPAPEPPAPALERVDISALNGKWIALRDGTGKGTATGPGGSYTVKLVYGEADLTVTQDGGKIFVREEAGDFIWEIFSGETLVDTIFYDEYTAEDEVTEIELNRYEYEPEEGVTTIVTLLSESKVYLQEIGSNSELGENISEFNLGYYLEKVAE